MSGEDSMGMIIVAKTLQICIEIHFCNEKPETGLRFTERSELFQQTSAKFRVNLN